MKQTIRLKESEFRHMISESVKRVLREWNETPDFIIKSITVNDNDVSDEFFERFGDTFENKYVFSSNLNKFLKKFGIQAYDVDTANDFGEEGDEIFINTNSDDVIEVHGGYEDLIGDDNDTPLIELQENKKRVMNESMSFGYTWENAFVNSISALIKMGGESEAMNILEKWFGDEKSLWALYVFLKRSGHEPNSQDLESIYEALATM